LAASGAEASPIIGNGTEGRLDADLDAQPVNGASGTEGTDVTMQEAPTNGAVPVAQAETIVASSEDRMDMD
jgi:hypothetical protein